MPKGKPAESGMVQAARPAAMAKEMLSEILGRIQDIRNPALDIENLSRYIAKSVGALYSVQTSEPDEPRHREGVSSAMAHLSRSLEILQEVPSDEAAIADTSRVIAKVLAILFTIAKAQARHTTRTEPVSLVEVKPTKPDPRRSFRRFGVEAEVGLQSDTNFFTGFTEDISMGGIFVATFDIKPKGSRVSISFTLPNGHVVMADGVVRWLREYNTQTPDIHPGMGIQFEALSEEDTRLIRGFFRQRSPIFFEE